MHPETSCLFVLLKIEGFDKLVMFSGNHIAIEVSSLRTTSISAGFRTRHTMVKKPGREVFLASFGLQATSLYLKIDLISLMTEY